MPMDPGPCHVGGPGRLPDLLGFDDGDDGVVKTDLEDDTDHDHPVQPDLGGAVGGGGGDHRASSFRDAAERSRSNTPAGSVPVRSPVAGSSVRRARAAVKVASSDVTSV